ncbi:hypothetical protein EVAR_25069_1 [Eumeta japonica]|uniref:Uncharacterized protein n=1 Tax=Eumeta variegata TaxID=151549 RepID=A0A4C1V9V4_EUMVA|nr:hypothetical protein EVAR_25069_1 [Eumeta japonica]
MTAIVYTESTAADQKRYGYTKGRLVRGARARSAVARPAARARSQRRRDFISPLRPLSEETKRSPLLTVTLSVLHMKLVNSGISPRTLSLYFSLVLSQLLCANSDSNVLFYSNFKLNANPRTLICEQGGRVPPMSPTPTTSSPTTPTTILFAKYHFNPLKNASSREYGPHGICDEDGCWQYRYLVILLWYIAKLAFKCLYACSFIANE